MIKHKLLVSAVLLSLSSIAAAYTGTGTYGEINVGSNFYAVHYGHNSTMSGFSHVGVNANVGYNFTQYVAAEVGYTRYFSYLSSVDIAAKFILPLNVGKNGASLFVKVGPAYTYNDWGHEVRPLVGIGGAIGLTPNLDFNVQAQSIIFTERHYSGSAAIGLLSGGLTYHFG